MNTPLRISSDRGHGRIGALWPIADSIFSAPFIIRRQQAIAADISRDISPALLRRYTPYFESAAFPIGGVSSAISTPRAIRHGGRHFDRHFHYCRADRRGAHDCFPSRIYLPLILRASGFCLSLSAIYGLYQGTHISVGRRRLTPRHVKIAWHTPRKLYGYSRAYDYAGLAAFTPVSQYSSPPSARIPLCFGIGFSTVSSAMVSRRWRNLTLCQDIEAPPCRQLTPGKRAVLASLLYLFVYFRLPPPKCSPPLPRHGKGAAFSPAGAGIFTPEVYFTNDGAEVYDGRHTGMPIIRDYYMR